MYMTEKLEQAVSKSHSSEKNYVSIIYGSMSIVLRNHQPPPFRSCAESLYYCSWQTSEADHIPHSMYFEEAWY